ncbi:MAG TPA: cellulase family glycosylhydrolase [Rugosimonospora sp.]|nr:cellulase family glycosylhydrolase [Rugosimonospora sp.]
MRRARSVLAGESGRHWLGVNFWSRVGGPRMWSRYDEPTVVKELQVLADHGLTVTRSFFFWPDFMPEPDRLDDRLLNRFASFLDRHSELGMRTVPTLIVGHMSGENWDPAWRAGRDLYTDVWLVSRQAWFAEQVACRFGSHPAVAAWLLSNEMPLYGGPGTPETVSAWAQLVIQGLRAGGAHQPVSIGDGAWTIETSGIDSGYRLSTLRGLVDWIGPHVYPMGDDQLRQFWRAAFICDLAGSAGLPVLLEEFGASSDFVSEEHLGHWYRQLLHTSLTAGSTGWIGWNNTDFDDLADEPPYRHHPFELHFGVTDVHGAPKSALREMAAFRQVLDAVEPDRCTRTPTQVGLVVPAHADTVYPFTDERERPAALAAIEQAWLASREAAVPAGLIRESTGIPDDCRLYLLPSTKQLTGPGWQRLTELAGAGATVYVSYSAGVTDNQRGPWYAGVDRIFGVRHGLRYGLVDRIPEGEVAFEFTADLGDLPAGSVLRFAAGGGASLRGYLPVEPVEAEVLATDAAGRPALLRRAVGAGSLIFCTYPLEGMAAATPGVNPEQTWRLYRALAVHAGVTPVVRLDEPRVLVDSLDRDDGARFVWLISQSPVPVTVSPVTPTGSPLHELHTTAEASTVEIPAFGVRVLHTPQEHT